MTITAPDIECLDFADVARELLPLLEPEPELDWKLSGLCRQADPDQWYPDKGASVRDAKRVCRLVPRPRRVPGMGDGQRRAVRGLGWPVRTRTACPETRPAGCHAGASIVTSQAQAGPPRARRRGARGAGNRTQNVPPLAELLAAGRRVGEPAG